MPPYRTYIKIYYLSYLFCSFRDYSNLTMALRVISIGEESATNRCRFINTFERKKKFTQNNEFLKRYCVLFRKWRKK